MLADAVAQAQASAADAPPGAAPEALAALLHEAVEKALTQAELAVQAEAKRGAQREAQRLLPSEPEATPAPPARPDAATRQARDARRQERLQAVAPLLQQAEEALAGGNRAGAHRHLADIDSGLAGASLPEALRTRLNAVHAEVARLKGWQSWGGGRARDDLVQEAQTLATATTAALADPQQAAKLPVKQLADAIDDLRKRWKELDRLGGATNQALWHAFDAALKTCFEPVGAHLDQLKARRKENLAARHQLLDALDAAAAGGQAAPVSVGTVGAVASAIPAPPAAPAAPAIPATPAIPVDRLAAPLVNPHPDAASNVVSNGTPSPSVDWRERARALMHFQTEWRKLGPVEHTVPHKARDALVARMQASVARIESPLQQARQSAQQTREQLVARAVALREEAAGQKHGRDIVARVRELQEQWQQHARSLPLARQAENALWAEFKTATDAVFAQRDAAFGARDAELLANQAAREALIRRLEALTEQTPAAEFKRTLAEVDAEWLQPVDVPRQQVAPLDARFRNARQAAQQVLAGSAQRVRQARFEALQHKLDLCEQLEARLDMRSDARLEMQLEARLDTQLDAQLDAQLEKQSDARSENSAADNPPTTAEWAARWAAAPSLQPAWEQALAARWQQAVDKAGATRPANASSALEALLLQLEAALGLASPADVQAARRDMKLRAMKAALEGRSAKQPPPPSIDALTHAALRHAHPDPTQRDRLHAILAALRSHEISPP